MAELGSPWHHRSSVRTGSLDVKVAGLQSRRLMEGWLAATGFVCYIYCPRELSSRALHPWCVRGGSSVVPAVASSQCWLLRTETPQRWHRWSAEPTSRWAASCSATATRPSPCLQSSPPSLIAPLGSYRVLPCPRDKSRWNRS